MTDKIMGTDEVFALLTLHAIPIDFADLATPIARMPERPRAVR